MAILVLLLGFPLPISNCSVECHLPFLLSLCRALDPRLSPAPHGIYASQLSPLGPAHSSLQRNFSPIVERDKKHSPGTIHLTFHWQSYMLKVKDFSLCCSSVRVHTQTQMDEYCYFYIPLSWDLINGDGYYPFVSGTGEREVSLTKISTILGVCLLIAWMCMLTISIPLTLLTVTSLSFCIHRLLWSSLESSGIHSA